jgi:hypothetical protein
MKRDKAQITFDKDLARPIKPDTTNDEPMLWFQNLHLVRSLGVGDTEKNRIRKFQLRRGLNVLWAEPEDPETSDGLYGDGFAGHATGKSLFCRILRHLLGESNYGTSELEEHVKDTFQELWAVATVRVDGTTWVVGKPLAGPGAEFAMEDGKVETVFEKAPEFEGYEKFAAALESRCDTPLAIMHPEKAWRNLIPWIARDQEARFSSITAWRDSSSGADNPINSSGAKHLILRAMLRLLEKDEFDLRQHISEKEEQVRAWNVSLPIKQTAASGDLERVARSLKRIPKVKVDLVDLGVAKAHVVSQRGIRKEALEHYKQQPESPEVVEARRQLQIAESKKTSSETRIKSLEEEIPGLIEESEKSLLLVDKVKKFGMKDAKRVTENACPNSYLMAVKNKCTEGSPEDVAASMAQISELEEQAKGQAAKVQAKRDDKARLETQTDQLDGEIEAKKGALSQAQSQFPSPALAVEREVTLLETVKRELDSAIKSAAAESNVTSEIQAEQNAIFEAKEKLVLLREEAEQKLKAFSDLFGDIVRAVLGASITASADLGERAINLHVKRTRELGGAAIESIKTIAFDLAAMLHGVEGKCDHPGFLIHDGPREADMAQVIYERFFYFARRMEAAFEPEQATFQYILTTTTNPPSDMQEGSVWLLGEKLSGKTSEGRLLREDF